MEDAFCLYYLYTHIHIYMISLFYHISVVFINCNGLLSHFRPITSTTRHNWVAFGSQSLSPNLI